MDTDKKLRIVLRPADPGDADYLVDAWLGHWITGANLPRHMVEAGARKVIERLIMHPRTKVVIAEDVDEEHPLKRVAGVLCHTGDLVHFVGVKYEKRHYGVARSLLGSVATPGVNGARPTLRCWWLSRGASAVSRCVRLQFEPLAIVEL